MAEPDSPASSSETNQSSFVGNPMSSPSSSSDSSSLRCIASVTKASFINFLPANIRSVCKDALDKIFSYYIDGGIDIEAFELEVLKLIKDVPTVVEAFKNLLPPANLTASASASNCTFNDKVRARLYDDTKSYIMWLTHMIQYRNGYESFPEFKRNMEAPFGKMADLWEEFDAEFAQSGGDDADADGSNQDSNSPGTPLDSSYQEPVSKRRKAK